jgi:hypothetical protein
MKKYVKDYKLVTKLLPNGKTRNETEYIGEYYISRLSGKELTKRKVYCLALALCSDIMMIGIGLINTVGSRVAYVALPYVILFLPSVYCLMGAVRFITAKDKLEHTAFDRSVNRIRKSATGQIILSAIAVIGDIICLFSIKNLEKLFLEAIFLSGMIVILILSILMLRIIKKPCYEAERPDDLRLESK